LSSDKLPVIFLFLKRGKVTKNNRNREIKSKKNCIFIRKSRFSLKKQSLDFDILRFCCIFAEQLRTLKNLN